MTQRRPHTEAELVEFVRAIDVPAPDSLHASVQALISEREATRYPLPLRARAALLRAFASGPRLAVAAGAVGAVALAIALSVGGGASGPSLRQAAALTLLPATSPAPAESSARRTELVATVDGVTFPYWERDLGWRSTGTRSDRLDGRAVMTVFYADRRGAQVGYAIVAGTAPRVSGGTVINRGGVAYRLLRENGAPVITWQRGGHMCVVSGRGVDAATLLLLASWHEPVRA
ncbi:MAG TPA: hypothetical protein VNZ05_08305 [Solirubrobacteraceae bacterium]|jgi:hypothetical protein|nr:hypothetical protein [Solirubrobacteraceae bacterium]